MLYFFAIVLPPVAVLFCGRPFLAFFTLLLTIPGWIPGAVLALFVVNNHYSDERAKSLERAYYAAADAYAQHRDG